MPVPRLYPTLPGETSSQRRRRLHRANEAAYRVRHRQKTRDMANAETTKVKVDVLTAYGKGGRLQCCGEGCTVSDIDILTLDHILDNGAQDRKTRTQWMIYRTLRREGYPKGEYQTLCMNHNFKKMVINKRLGRKKDGE